MAVKLGVICLAWVVAFACAKPVAVTPKSYRQSGDPSPSRTIRRNTTWGPSDSVREEIKLDKIIIVDRSRNYFPAPAIPSDDVVAALPRGLLNGTSGSFQVRDFTYDCTPGLVQDMFPQDFLAQNNVNASTPGAAVACSFSFNLRDPLFGLTLIDFSGTITGGLAACPPSIIYQLNTNWFDFGPSFAEPGIEIGVEALADMIGIPLPPFFPDTHISFDVNMDSQENFVLTIDMLLLNWAEYKKDIYLGFGCNDVEAAGSDLGGSTVTDPSSEPTAATANPVETTVESTVESPVETPVQPTFDPSSVSCESVTLCSAARMCNLLGPGGEFLDNGGYDSIANDASANDAGFANDGALSYGNDGSFTDGPSTETSGIAEESTMTVRRGPSESKAGVESDTTGTLSRSTHSETTTSGTGYRSLRDADLAALCSTVDGLDYYRFSDCPTLMGNNVFGYSNSELYFGNSGAYAECYLDTSSILGEYASVLSTDAECAPGCPNFWLADGVCDTSCNVEACNYDQGDCIN